MQRNNLAHYNHAISLRCRSIAATWGAIQSALHTAGVTRVADITQLDSLGLPIAHAIRPGSRTVCVSMGKGTTKKAALLGAAMEALETFYAERPKMAVSPMAVPRSAELLRRPDLAKSDTPSAGPLPTTANDSQRGANVLGVDLITNAQIPVSVFQVKLDFSTDDRLSSSQLFEMSSVGLCSGNTSVEASLHGLTEIIESDAHQRLQTGERELRSAFDLEKLPSSRAREQIRSAVAGGASINVYSITGPTGVPTAIAYIEKSGAPTFAGLGCHLIPQIAAVRAVFEAAQSRLGWIVGSRDDLHDHLFRRPLTLGFIAPQLPFAQEESLFNAHHSLLDFRNEVAQRIYRMTGQAPILVRLSAAKTEYCVAKVVSPGMRRANVER